MSFCIKSVVSTNALEFYSFSTHAKFPQNYNFLPSIRIRTCSYAGISGSEILTFRKVLRMSQMIDPLPFQQVYVEWVRYRLFRMNAKLSVKLKFLRNVSFSENFAYVLNG